jgi:hypothetical protein
MLTTLSYASSPLSYASSHLATPTIPLTGSLGLLGRLHEEGEEGAQSQDVHKLDAVVRPLGAGHRVVQHSQRSRPRLFLLSKNKEQDLGDS